jgi:hypothetical protein
VPRRDKEDAPKAQRNTGILGDCEMPYVDGVECSTKDAELLEHF